MTFGRNIGGGATGQCVAPDHRTPLGTSGTDADVVVPSGAAVQSFVAPRGGHVLIGLPSGLTVRVRVDINATALATDALYPGPMVWPMPISEGELVSLFGDGGGGTATVVMAK